MKNIKLHRLSQNMSQMIPYIVPVSLFTNQFISLALGIHTWWNVQVFWLFLFWKRSAKILCTLVASYAFRHSVWTVILKLFWYLSDVDGCEFQYVGIFIATAASSFKSKPMHSLFSRRQSRHLTNTAQSRLWQPSLHNDINWQAHSDSAV